MIGSIMVIIIVIMISVMLTHLIYHHYCHHHYHHYCRHDYHYIFITTKKKHVYINYHLFNEQRSHMIKKHEHDN